MLKCPRGSRDTFRYCDCQAGGGETFTKDTQLHKNTTAKTAGC